MYFVFSAYILVLVWYIVELFTFCCQELANVTALLYTNYGNNPQMLSSRFLNSDSLLVSASLVYILHDDLLWELFFFGKLTKSHPTSCFLLFQVQSMLAFHLWSSVHTLLSVENILREFYFHFQILVTKFDCHECIFSITLSWRKWGFPAK